MEFFPDKKVRFGDCSLDGDGILVTPGSERQLSRRLAVILRALVHAHGSIVSGDRLLDSFWGKGSGNPQNLAKAIFHLRQALADSRLVRIESVYGHGYRLCIVREGRNQLLAGEKALAICAEAAHRVYDQRDLAMNAALTMYRQAWELDPHCIPAYTGFADMQIQLIGSCQESTRHGWPKALQALAEAIHRDSQSADAHALLALGQCIFEWDIAAALRSLDMALSLAPAGFLPNEKAGRICLFQGKPKDAVTYVSRALEAKPMRPSTHGLFAYALGCSGDSTAAVDHVGKIYRLDPGNSMIQLYYVWVEAMYGDPEKACVVGEKVKNQLPNSATIAAAYAFALSKANRGPEARSLLKMLEDEGRYVSSCGAITAQAWRALGDKPMAIEALARGVQDRDYWLGITLNDPAMEELRSEPGFKEIYETVFGPGSQR